MKADARDVVILGQLDRPAGLERPDINEARFQARSALPVALAQRDLDGGPRLRRQESARVEMLEFIVCDNAGETV